MALTAKLKIILQANDTVVAESEDSSLWQQILVAINTEGSLPDNDEQLKTRRGALDTAPLRRSGIPSIDRFAQELGIDAPIVEGACGPTEEAPFIHLDKHHWEAFKKNTPTTGPQAVGAVALASTLLVLWKSAAGLSDPLLHEASGVLGTIGVAAKNPTRSITNCQWLQLRGGVIVLNPALTSKAIRVAKAYCLKQKSEQVKDL